MKAVDLAVQEFGKIDILFNNAGICAYGLAHELTENEWDVMLDINLKGAWLVARRIIPLMIKQQEDSYWVSLSSESCAGRAWHQGNRRATLANSDVSAPAGMK